MFEATSLVCDLRKSSGFVKLLFGLKMDQGFLKSNQDAWKVDKEALVKDKDALVKDKEAVMKANDALVEANEALMKDKINSNTESELKILGLTTELSNCEAKDFQSSLNISMPNI